MTIRMIQGEMNLFIIEHYLKKKLNISLKNMRTFVQIKLKNIQMDGILLINEKKCN